MTFREWRRFNFFDLIENADNESLSEALKDVSISVSTFGNNQLVLGDNLGNIYIINRSWHISTFKGYELRVTLAQQLRTSPYLVTIGEDEAGVNPIIKVWDTSRIDKNSIPFCTRITRAIPNNRPVNASALCVHENLKFFSVGFVDGSIILYRGDITRDKGSKQKLLRDSGSTVTGLGFKTTSTTIHLFVATDSYVLIYNVSQDRFKDREPGTRLDTIGCMKKCSVLAESVQESHFMIARNDAIYCYTIDGRGPCYAVDGEKVMIEWFRSYLVIISKNIRALPNMNNQNTKQTHTITILDIQNKFTVFSASLNEVKALFNEWGGFYILDCDNNVYLLDEKDLQSKLSLLFKKNLYDVAIRIAKSQQYDSDGLVDIFRQYGDHLYSKGDHAGAIEQYIKIIGKLEPSYVIRKFLDSQHIEKLTSYLQAVHKQREANEDHTTLLLNCYTKLNKTQNLKEFILMKDKDLDFDVDIAIKVCRQGSPMEALMLAKKHEKHDWYIKLLIEDHKKYKEVVEYIASLDFDNAEIYMKKYGNILIENEPHESTQFLKRLCTDYKPVDKFFITEGMLKESLALSQKADPEDYIHLFSNNSSRLVEFLEYLIEEGQILSTPVYDILLEHYLHIWETLPEGPEKNKYAQNSLKLLQNPEIKYDKAQALVVCHMHGFSEGILYLYEEQKLYQEILRHHMAKQDVKAVLASCVRFGHQEPTIWIQALWSCFRDTRNPPNDLLPEILTVIAKERLLSPQLVIEAIGTAQSGITLGHVRSYIINELKKEQDIINAEKELTEKYNKDTEKLKELLENLKSGPNVIQGSRCAACHHQLELPSLHFLCQHSYHQYCFQSYSENENECPACDPENKNLLDLLKAREQNKDLHETFHSLLEKAPDGFSLAAEYFGRGVFNKVKVVVEKPNEKPSTPKKQQEKKPKTIETQIQNYGYGAEARIRQLENSRSSSAIVPPSEGRIRLQEANMYSSSLEGNLRNAQKSVDGNKKNEKGVKYGKSEKKGLYGKNPFEDDYDDSKNPFIDVDSDENNPFNDDYDKNLNPFAS